MKKVSLFLVMFAFAFGFVSCEDEEAYVDVTFYNNSYTEMTITVDGKSKTAAADGQAVFQVEEGVDFTFQATTQGARGLVLEWDPTTLTSSSILSENEWDVDVPSTYFFLGIAHDKAGEADIDQLVVNSQSSAEKTDESLTIPQDGAVYDIGYYKALSSNKIWAYHAGAGDWWLEGSGTSEYYFTYPNTTNQGIDLYTQDLRNLKKKKAVRIGTRKSLLCR